MMHFFIVGSLLGINQTDNLSNTIILSRRLIAAYYLLSSHLYEMYNYKQIFYLEIEEE
ncbi:hypothetical protein [Shimazuella soli]|uniref:hypothetical protein n=1 Tax=Shimazuella soli TaxID=1892854 RepID=UPI001F11170D|nr:hypothetical protein [Shimazuella soli]